MILGLLVALDGASEPFPASANWGFLGRGPSAEPPGMSQPDICGREVRPKRNILSHFYIRDTSAADGPHRRVGRRFVTAYLRTRERPGWSESQPGRLEGCPMWDVVC